MRAARRESAAVWRSSFGLLLRLGVNALLLMLLRRLPWLRLRRLLLLLLLLLLLWWLWLRLRLRLRLRALPLLLQTMLQRLRCACSR